jgi:hypothetical protein
MWIKEEGEDDSKPEAKPAVSPLNDKLTNLCQVCGKIFVEKGHLVTIL